MPEPLGGVGRGRAFRNTAESRKERMSVFDFLDYREYLRSYIELQPRKGWGVISKIADALDVNQAHVSQVLSGAKDFSPEQALKLTKFLNCSQLESDYILLLVSFHRAGTAELKDYYKSKIDETKIQALKVKNHVAGFAPLTESQMNQFYSSWLYSAIRLFCSIDKGKTFQEIVHRFQIAPNELTDMIKFLSETGLLVKEDIYYRLGSQRTLAAKGSTQFLMHSRNWRLQSLQRCEKANEKDIFITSPMSLSRADYEKIRNEILEMFKALSKQVAASEAEEIVYLNIDLFLV